MGTRAPWRDLPPVYGDWSNTHRRFIFWRDKGIGEQLLEILIDIPDYEWLMIDASHCKVHPHAVEQEVAIKIQAAQKEAQHKATFGCGFAWYANLGLLLHKAQQQIALKQSN